MDVLSKEQRHKNMSKIRNKDTSIEILLRKALWHKGYRYRKNYKELPGCPDIVFMKYQVAIFCDGEFFHGKNWEQLRKQLENSNNSQFWINKIARNIDRDDEVNKQLKAMGWTVLRFWGKDIKKYPEECVKTIEEAIFNNLVSECDDLEEFDIDEEKFIGN